MELENPNNATESEEQARKQRKLMVLRRKRREYMRSYVRPEYLPMDEHHLTDKQLATRWDVSFSTLAKWRKFDYPKYIIHNRRIQYILADVLRIESQRIDAPKYTKSKKDVV